MIVNRRDDNPETEFRIAMDAIEYATMCAIVANGAAQLRDMASPYAGIATYVSLVLDAAYDPGSDSQNRVGDLRRYVARITPELLIKAAANQADAINRVRPRQGGNDHEGSRE